MRARVIVLAGPSGSGKSRLAARLGLPVLRLPSGAGHDAMMLHEIMPQAMLFVRGEHEGISHSPHESTTAEDAQLAARALAALLDDLEREPIAAHPSAS